MISFGQKFKCFAELKSAIREYENEKFVKVWTSHSRTISNAKKRGLQKELKPELRYAEITYSCIHSGKYCSHSKGLRPNQSTYRQDCEAKIRLRASDDGQFLEVVLCKEDHNHELNKNTFTYLPRERALDDGSKKMANKMLEFQVDKNVECPAKISLRASLDGTALEVYSFTGEHNHQLSEEEDMASEQHATCIETYNQNVSVRNYLEKMQERFKLEATEKSHQLAMTKSLIEIMKDQIKGFSSRGANHQDDLRPTEDRLIKVHRQLQPEKSLHDELALEIQQLGRRDSTSEAEYNHDVAIIISLNKMCEEYKCDLEEKNKQLAKTESLMESLNEEIEKFHRRKKRFQEGSCRVEEGDLSNKLKVAEKSSRRRSTEVNTNPALEDIMQIAAIKHSFEKECKVKNEVPSSDDDSNSMDYAALHSNSDISDSTNTADSSESESDTDSEPIAPKPSSSVPIRRAIRPFAIVTYPKKGSFANQEPVRIIRRPGSMTYITTNKENEKVPEPPRPVPAVMPVMLLSPIVPEVDPVPEDQCDMCLQVFEDANAVQEHKKNHHTQKETGGYIHSCNMCNFTNIRLCHLKRHLKKHVREKKRLETVYKCHLCPFTNHRESNLKKHVLIHSNERPYTCDICHKAFKINSALENHLISHSDKRPFVCKVCGMAFKHKAVLNRHHQSKHLGIKRKSSKGHKNIKSH